MAAGEQMTTAPGGYPRRQLSTLFLRVPLDDWNEIRVGAKREFRMRAKPGLMNLAEKCPTPVVAYSGNVDRGYGCKLAVLLAQRQERLVEIADSPTSLELEGFPSYDEFKRYWRTRHKGIYKPLQQVVVNTLRPWRDTDAQDLGRGLMRQLYGPYFPPADFSDVVRV
jgi:hypothetical protein